MNEWNRIAAQAVDWLISTSWQAAVLALLVVAAQWMFRRVLTARWRYLLWFLVVGRLLIPSLPESPTSVYRYVPSSPAKAMMFAESLSPSDSLKADAPPALGTARLMDAPPVTIPFKSILFTIWMGGVLGLMALLIQRNVRFHRVVSANGKPAGESERKVAQLVTTEMKLGRSIPIIEIDLLETPAVVGLFNPKLLLPRRLALRLSDEDLGMIFWHEMAHVNSANLSLDESGPLVGFSSDAG
jgi:bla regulator protein BlaR1